MSNLKPCANPRICGVQNHRPGTTCQAERASSLGGLASNLTSAPPSSRGNDVSASTRIVGAISEQEGWEADDIDEWDGHFYSAATEPVNLGRELARRRGFTQDELDDARELEVMAVVTHNTNEGVSDVGLSVMDQDEGMIDVPEEITPEYLKEYNGTPYRAQFTCSPEDVPRAMEWLKNEGVPAAIQLRLERDYPRQDAPSAESIQATMSSVDGWDHSAERDSLGRYGSLGKTRSVRQHLPEDWVDPPVPGYGDDYLREYKVTPSAEHNSKSRVHRGMSFAFLDESDKSVSLQPEDLPPYVTPTTRYQGGVLSFTAPASRIAETMEWMNDQGSEMAAKRRAQYLAENYTPEQEARRIRRQREDPNPDTIWTI